MESSVLPQTDHRFKRRMAVGLLVAGGVTVGLTAPSWASSDAHAQADNRDGPAAGSHTGAPGGTDVHKATLASLRNVAQKATQAELVSMVKTTVRTPTTVRTSAVREYRVRANDTLTSIARSQLGDASKYREIFDLNKGKPQPGGGSLTDPNLIQVGWVLQLPSEHMMTPQMHPAAGVELTTLVKPSTTTHAVTKAHPAASTHSAAKAPAATKARPAASTHHTVRKASQATAVSGGSPQAIARSIVPSGQFGCFSDIITRESGWNVHATNPSSGAYGLPQSLPGSKMASAGPDWRDDATTQIKWALTYMDSRYGSPCDAWSFWQNHNWY